MEPKQNLTAHKDRASVSQQAESTLKIAKERAGEVMRIAINRRTMIELPANLSQEEIDARIEKYMRLHHLT